MGQELSLAAEDTAAVCSGEEGYVYNINPQRRPRVLYLTHHLPWPELSGGRLREAQLIRRLLKDHDIDLIAVSRTAEEDRNFAQGLRLVGLRVHVFASEECEGAPLVRRRSSGPARSLLNSLLTANSRAYDLVHVEGHYLFGLVPPEWQPRTLLVEHNVESHLLEQFAVARTEPDLLQVARQVHAEELKVWKAAGLVATVTEEDRHRIRTAIPGLPVRVVPDGADHVPPGPAEPSHDSEDDESMVFAANFAYEPNVDALGWLLTDIFPLILSQRPDARLTLVGTSLAGEMFNRALSHPSVDVIGPVDEMACFLDRAKVVLCPLRVGGGVKVKVLEALRRGRAIVTTPVGCQGLRTLLPGALIVATGAESLAAHTCDLLRDPTLRREQELVAIRAARALPTWDEAAEVLRECWCRLAGPPLRSPT